MNDTPMPVPTPPTLPELVTALADHESYLQWLRDELKQAKRRNVELHSLVGAAAIATGERKPHPAVTVQIKCKARTGYIPVKVKEDLSAYRSDGNKRTGWCAGCIADPDKCGGAVGVSCARYEQDDLERFEDMHRYFYAQAL